MNVHFHFNPRAPCGARQAMSSAFGLSHVFQSTRPLRGATSASGSTMRPTGNFNPRAPCGARRQSPQQSSARKHFNPRAPCGARPRRVHNYLAVWLFQSTRPLRGATDRLKVHFASSLFQSTRPLRGATNGVAAARQICIDFNPRAPCGARPKSITLAPPVA